MRSYAKHSSGFDSQNQRPNNSSLTNGTPIRRSTQASNPKLIGYLKNYDIPKDRPGRTESKAVHLAFHLDATGCIEHYLSDVSVSDSAGGGQKRNVKFEDAPQMRSSDRKPTLIHTESIGQSYDLSLSSFEACEDKNVIQKPSKRGSLVANMRRTLRALGSFGGDGQGQTMTSGYSREGSKRRSLIHRAASSLRSQDKRARTKRDPGGRYGGVESVAATKHSQTRQVRTQKRDSLINMVINIKAKSNGKAPAGETSKSYNDNVPEPTDRHYKCKNTDESEHSKSLRAKKRGSVLNIVMNIKNMHNKTAEDLNQAEKNHTDNTAGHAAKGVGHDSTCHQPQDHDKVASFSSQDTETERRSKPAKGRAGKRRCLVEMAYLLSNNLRLAKEDEDIQEQSSSDKKKSSHSRSTKGQGSERYNREKDSAEGSVFLFDRIALERFSKRGILITNLTASTSTNGSDGHCGSGALTCGAKVRSRETIACHTDRYGVNVDGEDRYNEKISSILYRSTV